MSRAIYGLGLVVLVLAGCVTPVVEPDRATPMPPTFEVRHDVVPRDLFHGIPVPAGHDFLLIGHQNRLVDGRTHPIVFRLAANGTVTEEGVVGGAFYGEWANARVIGGNVEALGYERQSGMCCAKYYDGYHADGYYVRYEPFVETWKAPAGEPTRRPIACGARGEFTALWHDEAWLVFGGYPSFSTDAPAKDNATQILRWRPGEPACEPIGMSLPVPMSRPLVLPRGSQVHVFAREDGRGWRLDLAQENIHNSTITLPPHLRYHHATLVDVGDDAFLLGASSTLENQSRILRINPADGHVQIQAEVLPYLAWGAVGAWDGQTIWIVGGAQRNEGGTWIPSHTVTRYHPSRTAANLVPPVARIHATVENLTVTLDGGSSHDPDGFIAIWYWRFVDVNHCYNNYDDCWYGEGPTARHRYAAPGTYTVELTVTDDAGLTQTSHVEIVVPAA